MRDILKAKWKESPLAMFVVGGVSLLTVIMTSIMLAQAGSMLADRWSNKTTTVAALSAGQVKANQKQGSLPSIPEKYARLSDLQVAEQACPYFVKTWSVKESHFADDSFAQALWFGCGRDADPSSGAKSREDVLRNFISQSKKKG